jgi:hypothetical protein
MCLPSFGVFNEISYFITHNIYYTEPCTSDASWAVDSLLVASLVPYIFILLGYESIKFNIDTAAYNKHV